LASVLMFIISLRYSWTKRKYSWRGQAKWRIFDKVWWNCLVWIKISTLNHTSTANESTLRIPVLLHLLHGRKEWLCLHEGKFNIINWHFFSFDECYDVHRNFIFKMFFSSQESFIIIMSIFMGNLLLHWLYFLINSRYESIVEKHEKDGSKLKEVLIGISYLIFSFCFSYFMYWVHLHLL
jgi:hypothetical protein